MTPGRKAPSTTAGFTLLEVLAATVVTGLLMVMVSQAMKFGMHSMRAMGSGHQEDLLAVDQAVRRTLAAAHPGIYPEPAPFQGASDSVSLMTELPIGTTGPRQRVEAVLTALGGDLVLRWRPYRHAEAFGPEPAWQSATLSEGVERVEFGYFGRRGAAHWSSSWTGERLPSFVRVTVTFQERSGLHWPPILVALVREPAEE